MDRTNEESSGGVVRFVFPKWFNSLRDLAGIALVVTPLYIVVLYAYGNTPRTTDVGYAPKQPVAYSHALHVNELGIDCLYCHNTVDKTGHAAIPPTQTCMNCHTNIRAQSEKLLPIREAHASGLPVEWVKVHDLPDYAYFNHSAHVRRGIGCASCHGRVDKMEVVEQVERLSMGWCLDCHRNPERHLRPLDQITNMAYELTETEQLRVGQQLKEKYNINPSTDCSTCHR